MRKIAIYNLPFAIATGDNKHLKPNSVLLSVQVRLDFSDHLSQRATFQFIDGRI